MLQMKLYEVRLFIPVPLIFSLRLHPFLINSYFDLVGFYLTDPVVSVGPAPRHDVLPHLPGVPEPHRPPRSGEVLGYHLAGELDLRLELNPLLPAPLLAAEELQAVRDGDVPVNVDGDDVIMAEDGPHRGRVVVADHLRASAYFLQTVSSMILYSVTRLAWFSLRSRDFRSPTTCSTSHFGSVKNRFMLLRSFFSVKSSFSPATISPSVTL